LSIGALAKATGIAVETLRTWENRYGFPVPQRKPSGHRVYSIDAVPRLRRISQVLARGHRAGEVVGASEEALDLLLQSTPEEAVRQPLPTGVPPAEDLPGLMAMVRSFDSERLRQTLLADWARTNPTDFLEQRIAPLVRAVGEGWEKGELEIRHEHFLSERVGDLLRSLRLPFEEKASGPLAILATLPGESHGLGLQMAALLLTVSGCRILYLGTEVPAPEVVSLTEDLGASAVALSVSIATKGSASSAAVRRLRERLPARCALVVGGEGAPRPSEGVTVVQDMRAMEEWTRQLAAGLTRGRAKPARSSRR